MQQYRCVECGKWCSPDEPGGKFEDVISRDAIGRYIGSTRLLTCGICVKKKKPVVVETVEKKAITADQKRLF